MYNRLSKNWFLSIWFILLSVVTAWSSLVLASTISQDPTLRTSDLTVRPNTFLLFIYLIIVGKSIIDTSHKAVESKELVAVLLQPVSPAKVAFGKFLGILISNLTLIAYGAGIMAIIQLGTWNITPDHPLTITGDYPYHAGDLWVGGYGITHYQIIDTILLATIATCMGFVYSILNSLDLKRRIVGIVLYSQLVSSLFILLRWNDDIVKGSAGYVTPDMQTLALFLITIVSLVSVYPVIRLFFFEVWLKETSGKKAMWFQKRSWGGLRWLERFFSPRMSRLIKKELVINVQKKEIVGNLIAILGLSALLIWGWQKIEGLQDFPARAQYMAYPAIISIGIYLAAILQCGFIGLGSIGKEGRKFWLLKSMPVHPEHIFRAKAIAILALSPITILGVTLPLPLILGYAWDWILFFILMGMACIMTFTGIGLIMGARYPNFNESTGGMPDVMSMYMLMLICLAFSGGMFIFAGYALNADRLGGLMATIICLEIGFIMMTIGIRGGAFMYSRIEPRPA
jgi:hypothetical protein